MESIIRIRWCFLQVAKGLSKPSLSRHSAASLNISAARQIFAKSQAGAGKTTVPDVYVENADPEIVKLQEHQQNAARPTAAEEARTLVNLAK